MIQLLELFGGIGSPRAALRNLGVPVRSIDYVELDEKAVRSYNAMFKDELKYNTQSVVGWNLRPDILVHGSPCQDFSIAGKKQGADNGSGTRSSLIWETIHIIEQMGEQKPKIVIWENVKNVLSKKMIKNFNMYLEHMEALGYSNSYKVLNAMDFGLPQNRNRIFIISVLDGEPFDFDRLKTRECKHIKEYLEEFDEVPEKYKVNQPSLLKKVNQPDPNSKFTGYIKVIKDYCDTITTKQTRCPNAGVVEYEKGQYRYLTERECWRLQGFSDKDFDAVSSVHPSRSGCLNGALYKQAGNSIPVTIFEEIFRVILTDWEEL